jgi:hypothetical protein
MNNYLVVSKGNNSSLEIIFKFYEIKITTSKTKNTRTFSAIFLAV